MMEEGLRASPIMPGKVSTRRPNTRRQSAARFSATRPDKLALVETKGIPKK